MAALQGAIFVNGSNVVLKGDTVFDNNTADYGGAIYLTESSELNFTEGGRVSFVTNHAADYGGAIYLEDSSELNITERGNVYFVNNYAGYYGDRFISAMSGASSVAGGSLGAPSGPDGVAADPASEPLVLRGSAGEKKGSPAEDCCE